MFVCCSLNNIPIKQIISQTLAYSEKSRGTWLAYKNDIGQFLNPLNVDDQQEVCLYLMGHNGPGCCKDTSTFSSTGGVRGGGGGKSSIISVSLMGGAGGGGGGGRGAKNTSSSSCDTAILGTSWRLDSEIRREKSGFVGKTGPLGRICDPVTSGCGGDGVATGHGKSFRVSSEVLVSLEFCRTIPGAPDGLFWLCGPVSGNAIESRLGWHSLSPLCQSRLATVPGEVKGQGSPTDAARPEALCALGRSEYLWRSRLNTGAFCWTGPWFSW